MWILWILLRNHFDEDTRARQSNRVQQPFNTFIYHHVTFSLNLSLFHSACSIPKRRRTNTMDAESARLTHEFISGFAGRRAPVLIWLSAHIHGKQQHPESHPKRNSQSTRGRTESANLSRPQFVGGWYGNWEGGLYLIPAVAERIKWTISTKFPWQTNLDVETRRPPKFGVRKSFPVEWTSLQMGKWGNQFISPLIRWVELL